MPSEGFENTSTLKKMPQLGGDAIESALLALNVVPRQLPREFEGVTNRIGPHLDLLFRVISSAFAVRQPSQSDRQGQQVEQFSVASLLIGGGSSGIRFGHRDAPSIGEAVRQRRLAAVFELGEDFGRQLPIRNLRRDHCGAAFGPRWRRSLRRLRSRCFRWRQ